MINYKIAFISLLFLAPGALLMAEDGADLKKFFPDIEGFSKNGEPTLYNQQSLYEFIDGAADIYLNFEFRELAVLNYEKPAEQSLKIEIYRHENPDFGFGIYSQERFGGILNFIKVGTQGYYEAGILNFFKDCYYVKISGYNVEDEESVLTRAALKIASMLPGEEKFPSVFNDFPVFNRLSNQELFVAKNFLGYPYFKMAYVAEYAHPMASTGSFSYFVMQSTSKDDCKEMLTAYFNHLNRQETVQSDTRYMLEDPYYGVIDLIWSDKRIKGIMGLEDEAARTDFLNYNPADYFIETGESNLAYKKTATSSSNQDAILIPANVVDGDLMTRWSSEFSDPQWILIDLGKEYTIDKIRLFWETAFATSYIIQTSTDTIQWKDIYTTEDGNGVIDRIGFNPVKTRYVRINGQKRGTPWGYSLYEIVVFKKEK